MIRANDRGLATPPPAVEEPPRRAGLLTGRNILVAVGVVAWLALLLLFVLPRFTSKPAPAAKASAAAAGAVAQPAAAQASAGGATLTAPKAIPAPELTISNRVFNLAGAATTGTGYKYLKLSIVVQFSDPKKQFAKASGTNLATLETAFAADHPGALAAFNDVLTTTVSSKTSAELATLQGKESLRQELIKRFNAALSGTSLHVTYVIFSDFVMQ